MQAYIERFSIGCRKAKTKAITMANHNARKQHSKQIHVTGAKCGKTRVTKSRLVLVLYLIG